MNKLKVVVLMGGKSSEHEVSVMSGKNVIASMDPEKYEVLPVIISKDGSRWRLTDRKSLALVENRLSVKDSKKDLALSEEKNLSGPTELSEKKVDLVFIAMHGKYGEDGTIQGMLDLAGLKYTGSGVAASAVGMDKLLFRKIMKGEGIRIPKYTTYKVGDDVNKIVHELGPFPYFVKPASEGSSVGASIAKNEAELHESLESALKYDKTILVDEYIKGREVTCTVMGNSNPITLPVIEIVPKKGEFFDYDSKYTESGSEEIVPARISKELTNKIQELAIKVYKSISCHGFGRVDFILKDNKEPVVLEINTIPGLTEASLAPISAKAAGMSYAEFIDKIIKYATE